MNINDDYVISKMTYITCDDNFLFVQATDDLQTRKQQCEAFESELKNNTNKVHKVMTNTTIFIP